MDSQAFVPPESFVYSDDGSNRWIDNSHLLSAAHSDFQTDCQSFNSLGLFTTNQHKTSDVNYATMAQIMQQQPFRPRPQGMHNTTFTYNTTVHTRSAESTDQPSAKRARLEDVPVERCYSQTGSQSTCCSSCSEGIPCAKPGCEDDKSCEVCAICSPDDEPQNPRVQVNCPTLPIETRLQDWNNSVQSAWIPPTPQASYQNGIGNTTNHNTHQSFGGLAYNTAHSSSAAMTPSMANNTSTPFSQNNSHQTPNMQHFDTHPNAYNSSLADLSGAGALFQPSWHSSSMSTANNDMFTFNCGWDGCEVALDSSRQLLAHCFNTHVNPQMGFTCPIQPNVCSTNIGTDPLDHLRNDHGFDLDFLDQGWTCPAPDCAPDQILDGPDTFKTHLMKAHTKPTGGILVCEMQHCDTTFKDLDQFSQHLTRQHLDDIDLGPQPHHTSPASASTKLPTDTATDAILSDKSSSQGNSSREPSTQETSPEANQEADYNANQKTSSQEPQVKDDGHTCRWLVTNNGACGSTFDSASKLQEHIIQGHLASLDKTTGYKCCWEGCRREAKRGNDNSGFSQRGKLERHMATHTNFKCCTCKVCGKTFSAEQALVQHMNLHSNLKPWECKHCGKKFPQQSACTIHERTHTKEKPLKCEICGKAFSESSNLSKHRKTHGEKGAHACTFPGCLKSFHRLDQLKRHQTMHTRTAGAGVGVGVVVSDTETKPESGGE